MSKFLKSGEKPGKGIYVCTQCKQIIVLNDQTDTLPPCPKCNNGEFINGEDL